MSRARVLECTETCLLVCSGHTGQMGNIKLPVLRACVIQSEEARMNEPGEGGEGAKGAQNTSWAVHGGLSTFRGIWTFKQA